MKKVLTSPLRQEKCSMNVIKKKNRERERVTTETVVAVKHEDVGRKKMRLGCLLVTTRVNSAALLKLYK